MQFKGFSQAFWGVLLYRGLAFANHNVSVQSIFGQMAARALTDSPEEGDPAGYGLKSESKMQLIVSTPYQTGASVPAKIVQAKIVFAVRLRMM